MKKIIATLILITSITFLKAQTNYTEPCAFDKLSNKKSLQKTEQKIQKALANITLTKAPSDSNKIIPVVVHIIHNGGTENISLAQVQSAIDVLNEDYGKLAGTPGNGAGVDTKVRFCLAKKDPNGNCTNGIIRINSTLTNHKTYERATLKELSFWDNEKYLNMYIVKSITGGVLGYSSFPGGPPEEDGIVVRHNVFGRVGTAASSMGRTTTHELGHWFGLYHTFNNGCGTDICTDGDYVCDTPPAANPNYNCTTLNTCSNDSPDLNDPKENYMDYTPDACKNMFTAGQRDRLQAALTTIRTTIWSEANLIATGCDTNYVAPATCPVKADFVCLTPEICVGSSIYFMDKSSNNATSWQWTFNGGTPSSSTSQNPTVVYNTLGSYDVKLVVTNANSTDSIVFSNYVVVSAPGIGDSLSFGQNFDNGLYPPTSITINNYDGGVTWELDSAASVSGKYSIKINNLINTNYGSKDELVLPSFNFTTAHPDSILKMTFKWAYARSDANYSDEMIVLLSTDCGVNFTQVYYRTGNSLVTGPTQTTPFIPDSSQWKDAFIYLNNYKTYSNVQIKIVNVTDGGNNLYIDNIYVGDGNEARPLPTGIASENKLLSVINVFPNPASEFISIETQENLSSIEIHNATGQTVKKIRITSSDKINISINELSPGIYFLKIQDINGNILTKKIIINK